MLRDAARMVHAKRRVECRTYARKQQGFLLLVICTTCLVIGSGLFGT